MIQMQKATAANPSCKMTTADKGLISPPNIYFVMTVQTLGHLYIVISFPLSLSTEYFFSCPYPIFIMKKFVKIVNIFNSGKDGMVDPEVGISGCRASSIRLNDWGVWIWQWLNLLSSSQLDLMMMMTMMVMVMMVMMLVRIMMVVMMIVIIWMQIRDLSAIRPLLEQGKIKFHFCWKRKRWNSFQLILLLSPTSSPWHSWQQKKLSIFCEIVFLENRYESMQVILVWCNPRHGAIWACDCIWGGGEAQWARMWTN